MTRALLRECPLPTPGAGKEARGRVLVVGGSVQTPGAVLLAGVAALRVGAGKLQVATAGPVAAGLALLLPEALVRGVPEAAEGALAPTATAAVAELASAGATVLVGPGMTGAEATAAAVAALLRRLPEVTVVLDALALTALEQDAGLLARFGGRAVLTPNQKELGLLLDEPADAVAAAPAGYAARAARRFGAVVLLGGEDSWVGTPDGRVFQDATGGRGLGTSGSGDVLAGVVAGLLARGAAPDRAALWAAHLHGRAGDRLAARTGPLGYLAREVADELPAALAELAG